MKKFLEYITARTLAGIKVRLWMAVGMSAVALLINFLYVSQEFDRLPQEVPVLFDTDGNISLWGHKSMINDFAEVRTIKKNSISYEQI